MKGFTEVQMFILMALYVRPATCEELAAKALTSTMRTQRSVERLARRGYVKLRGTKAMLEPSGRDVIERKFEAPVERWLDETMEKQLRGDTIYCYRCKAEVVPDDDGGRKNRCPSCGDNI